MRRTISMIDADSRIYLFKCGSADPIGDDRFKHIKILNDGFITAPSSINAPSSGRRFITGCVPGKVRLASLSGAFHAPTGKRSGVPAMKVRRVRIADILVDDNRRALRQSAVERKKESMSFIGMKTPITVKRGEDGLHLITGLHRLDAAKALGWETIDAAFFEGDEIEARMWQLLENLDHVDLTALERAEETAELIRITAQRFSRQHVGKKRGRPESVTAKVARSLPFGGKTEDAREKTAERAFKVADLSVQAKAEAKTCGLDDNQSALLAVANEPTPETQVAKLREIKSRRAEKPPKRTRVKKGKARVDAHEPASRPDQRPRDDVILAELRSYCSPEFKKTWAEATRSIKRQFLREVLLWEGGKPLSQKD